jgi:DNA-3-methyladenine glycosylase
MTSSEFRRLAEDDVHLAARAMLGAHLVLGRLRSVLVEVEAYGGPDDPGSHAFRGQTPRNATMFGPAGHAYVYFTYGNHWMLNLVCLGEGKPSAVLIRAARPVEGLDEMQARRGVHHPVEGLLSGPGKIAQAYGLDRSFDGRDLLSADSDLRLEFPHVAPPAVTGTRIGLAKGRGDDLPWRYMIAEERRWISARKPPRSLPSGPSEAVE